MKKSIYILEDNNDIRELLSYLLTEENYEVKGYPTVKSFKKQMQFDRPDMIVLDVMLTDGNGVEVCDELKSDKRTHNIPVLMMSANTPSSEIKDHCTADDFISKPFDIDDFVSRIDRYMH